MKRLHLIATIIFGFLAGLVILNRFYDLIQNSEAVTLIFVITYCLHPLIILIIGIKLFTNKKTTGFWMLLLFESYLLIRHFLEFRSYSIAEQPYTIPNEIIKSWTIPYFEFIFIGELLFGLTSIILLLMVNKRKTVGNNS